MSENSNRDALAAALEKLGREELLEISRAAALAARDSRYEQDRPANAGAYGSGRDPLVRTLALMALRDLRENDKLSYRELGAMLNVSHSRVAELFKQLETHYGDKLAELEERRAAGDEG